MLLLFGTWAVYVNPYRLQMRSLAAVNRLQGKSVKTPAQGPGWHRWLVTTLLGEDAFVRVTQADLSGKKSNDETAPLGSRSLVHLEKLSLDYTPITDSGIATLRSMPNLQHVSLRYTSISDRGDEHLARCRTCGPRISRARRSPMPASITWRQQRDGGALHPLDQITDEGATTRRGAPEMRDPSPRTAAVTRGFRVWSNPATNGQQLVATNGSRLFSRRNGHAIGRCAG